LKSSLEAGPQVCFDLNDENAGLGDDEVDHEVDDEEEDAEELAEDLEAVVHTPGCQH
jgi:hypothetical protein